VEDEEGNITSAIIANLIEDKLQSHTNNSTIVGYNDEETKKEILEMAKMLNEQTLAYKNQNATIDPQSDDDQINNQDHSIQSNTSEKNLESVVDNSNSTSEITLDPFLRKPAWELILEQIKADFYPFILLIPKPVRQFISKKSRSILQEAKKVGYGAIAPMLHTGSKYMLHTAKALERTALAWQKIASAHQRQVSTSNNQLIEQSPSQKADTMTQDSLNRTDDSEYGEIIEL
jgi:hypothetical protein